MLAMDRAADRPAAQPVRGVGIHDTSGFSRRTARTADLDVKGDGAGFDELTANGNTRRTRWHRRTGSTFVVPWSVSRLCHNTDSSLALISRLKSSTRYVSPSQKTSIRSLPSPVFGPSAV
jgi:hypothetical protein